MYSDEDIEEDDPELPSSVRIDARNQGSTQMETTSLSVQTSESTTLHNKLNKRTFQDIQNATSDTKKKDVYTVKNFVKQFFFKHVSPF